MQQRAVIAMALVREPDLIVADEITTALDVTVQAQILSLLSDLRHTLGMTLLLITHDLGIVAQLADRVAVMYSGSIVETSDVSSLFKSARHPYSRALLETVPTAPRRPDRLSSDPRRHARAHRPALGVPLPPALPRRVARMLPREA